MINPKIPAAITPVIGIIQPELANAPATNKEIVSIPKISPPTTLLIFTVACAVMKSNIMHAGAPGTHASADVVAVFVVVLLTTIEQVQSQVSPGFTFVSPLVSPPAKVKGEHLSSTGVPVLMSTCPVFENAYVNVTIVGPFAEAGLAVFVNVKSTFKP